MALFGRCLVRLVGVAGHIPKPYPREQNQRSTVIFWVYHGYILLPATVDDDGSVARLSPK